LPDPGFSDKLRGSIRNTQPTVSERLDMPKMKTHKGLKKRVKVSAGGKLTFKKGGSGHLMSGKNANRRRKLRRTGILQNAPLARRIIRALQA
jgi:large subunit ribosomal protein L35